MVERPGTRQTETLERIRLDGREIEYRVVPSKDAKKLRIKVALDGIYVVLPASRRQEEARAFLLENAAWVIGQMERMRRYQSIRKPEVAGAGEILFRGEPMPVRVLNARGWRGPNRVRQNQDGIAVLASPTSRTSPAATLENWLRKQAKRDIVRLVAEIAPQVNRQPTGIYVMGQRTKWGNCSAMGNLSFNWRLVLAPESVLRYLGDFRV